MCWREAIRSIILLRVPRYYMHMSDGHRFVEDHEGRDLPDDETARQEAVKGARDVMASELRGGQLDLSSFIEVEDETRKLLFTVTFAEAVKIIHMPDNPTRP
jgi:hypothetical protein